MKQFFITSTGTGIGKTFVTTLLCEQLRNRNKKIAALKPVISGWDEKDANSDTALILKSLGLPFTPENIDAISPWRFAAPLSPHMAAAQENRAIDLAELVAFCKNTSADITLLEGAGGVMAPINNTHTTLDWIAVLHCPVILTCGSYLGSLSHTLTAIEVLKNKQIPIAGLILCESESGAAPVSEIAQSLETFAGSGLPVVTLSRLKPGEKAPDITNLCGL